MSSAEISTSLPFMETCLTIHGDLLRCSGITDGGRGQSAPRLLTGKFRLTHREKKDKEKWENGAEKKENQEKKENHERKGGEIFFFFNF